MLSGLLGALDEPERLQVASALQAERVRRQPDSKAQPSALLASAELQAAVRSLALAAEAR
jgi:hypothetical protein